MADLPSCTTKKKDSVRQPLVVTSLYMFFVNLGIHLLRPGRDGIGASNGIENLPILFSCTFLVVLLLNYTSRKSKNHLSRNKHIYFQHILLIAGIVFFGFFNSSFKGNASFDSIYFVWVSTFNLWGISLAWNFVTGLLYDEISPQKIWIIAFSSTAGCVAGYGFAIVAEGNDITLSLVFNVIAFLLLNTILENKKDGINNEALTRSLQIQPALSPNFLLYYGLLISLYAIITTFLYFQQASMVIADAGTKDKFTTFFARLGLVINLIAMLFQLIFSLTFIKKAGTLFTVSFIPVVLIAGLLCFTVYSSFMLLIILMAFTKVASFSLIRPVRESLMAASDTGKMQHVKLFLDTAVYRGGDVVGSWLFVIMLQADLNFKQITAVSILLCSIWFIAIVKLHKISLLIKK